MVFFYLLLSFSVISGVTAGPSLIVSNSYGGLSNDVFPTRYVLEVYTNLDHLTYFGIVSIRVMAILPTNRIILHAHTADGKLKINQESVKVQHHGPHFDNLAKGVEFIEQFDFLVINVEPHLKPGTVYELEISFEGRMEEAAEGYYVVKDTTKPTRYLAVTKPSMAMARRIFPCFDEPRMKAIFIIKLGVKEEHQSFSGMPMKTETKIKGHDGWVLREYQETPLLSTFQISFLVSGIPLEARQTCNSVTYWYRQDFQDTGNLGCEIDGHFTSLYSKFGLPSISPVPLPKLDFILLPSFTDINLGVWGLITSKEVKDFTETKSKADLTILYERLAWQMFGGGIISPVDYRSAWILRSMCSYLAGVAAGEYLDSSFRYLLQFWNIKTWKTQFTAESDYKMETYSPKYGKVEEESEDELSVECKGVLLLRMVHRTLGDEMFKKGIRSFVNKYKYKVAGPEELWDTFNTLARGVGGAFTQLTPLQTGVRVYRLLGRVSEVGSVKLLQTPDKVYKRLTGAVLPFSVTMQQVMRSWTVQGYYPVITVYRQGFGFVRVSQKIYIGNFYEKMNPPDILWAQCFWIPLTYSTSKNPDFSNTQPKEWTGCEHGTFGLLFNAGVGNNDWLIFNNMFSGLYRVNYDDLGWALIIAALKYKNGFTKIDVMNRAQLVSDAMALGFTADLSYEVVFKLLTYLRHETDFLVWEYFFLNTKNLVDGLSRTAQFDQFKDYMRYILSPIYHQTFSDTTDLTECITRNKAQFTDIDVWKVTIFAQAGAFNVPSCVEYSKGLFAQWKSSKSIPAVTETYPQLLLKCVLCIAIKEGNSQDFQFLFIQFLKTKKADRIRKPLMHAVTCAYNEADIKRLLDWCFTKPSGEFSADDKKTVFQSLTKRITSFETTLKYSYQNFAKMYQYNKEPSFIAEIIEAVGSQMNPSEVVELEKFLDSKAEVRDLEEIKYALKKVKSVTENKRVWLELNLPSIVEALQIWQETPK